MTAIFFLVYLQGIIESLTFALFMVSLIIGMVGFFFCIEHCKEVGSPYLIAAAVMLTLSVLLPSKNTMNVLIGMQVTTEISEVMSRSGVGKKALSIINIKLDEMVSSHDKQK